MMDSKTSKGIYLSKDTNEGSTTSNSSKYCLRFVEQAKSLTEREAENERRKERGLPPLPDPENHNPSSSSHSAKTKSQSTRQTDSKRPSFLTKSLSSNQASSNLNALKRKVLSGGALDDGDEVGEGGKGTTKKKKKTAEKSSQKREEDTVEFRGRCIAHTSKLHCD
ncbi:hypothetical protein C8R42DRAFT_714195 [Lentinula raphanica]|nr:hypothetical protein C8R42DRAFT_714195 [Lentinula raphanica]